MVLSRKKNIGKSCVILLVCLLAIKGIALGQCLPVQTRVYANSEDHSSSGLLSSVAHSGDAADADLTSFSTLNTGILGSAIQYLNFPSVIASGTPVTIKLSVPAGLLGLFNGVIVQPVDAAHNPIGAAITNTQLATLLSNPGETELTVTPTGNYQGVAISLGGLNVGTSINIFDAYYYKTTLISAGCTIPLDAYGGVRANTVLGTIATATGSSTNPRNAIDNDLTSYAELNVGAQAFSEVYHTTVFNTLSQKGDTVKMILRNTGSGLLSVQLISTITIQFYNGATKVGLPLTKTTTPLAISLLPDASDIYTLKVVAPSDYDPYDRVEVQIGGAVSVGLTTGLRIYDVKRLIRTPVVTVNGSVTTTTSVCQGSTTTFTVGNSQDCTTYKWYDAPTGGHLLQDDPNNPNYTPPAAGLNPDNDYYVEAVRNGCTEATVRTPVKLKVNPPPTAVATMGPTICGGTPTITWAYTATNTPTTYSIVWDATAHTTGFVDVTNAVLPGGNTGNIPVTVPTNAPTGTYNGTLYVTNANGCVSAGQPISVAVDATPTKPVINLNP